MNSIFCEHTKTFVAGSDNSFYCYLFGTSSPACCPGASPAAASPASASAPTPTAGAAQVSEVDLQLRCYVVGWFAEMVVTGLVSRGLLRGADDDDDVCYRLTALCISFLRLMKSFFISSRTTHIQHTFYSLYFKGALHRSPFYRGMSIQIEYFHGVCELQVPCTKLVVLLLPLGRQSKHRQASETHRRGRSH